LPLLIVSNVSHAKEDCESFTAAGSRCRQNSKAENFTSSSVRLLSEMWLIRIAREERLPFLIQLIKWFILGVFVVFLLSIPECTFRRFSRPTVSTNSFSIQSAVFKTLCHAFSLDLLESTKWSFHVDFSSNRTSVSLTRFIRLSAPLFNDVMVLGCIACLATVFLFGLRKFQDPKNSLPLICKVNLFSIVLF